jgi:hypothetical protein
MAQPSGIRRTFKSLCLRAVNALTFNNTSYHIEHPRRLRTTMVPNAGHSFFEEYSSSCRKLTRLSLLVIRFMESEPRWMEKYWQVRILSQCRSAQNEQGRCRWIQRDGRLPIVTRVKSGNRICIALRTGGLFHFTYLLRNNDINIHHPSSLHEQGFACPFTGTVFYLSSRVRLLDLF